MDDDLFVVDRIDKYRTLCISSLSSRAVAEGDIPNLGARGYFIYESDDRVSGGGINILAKATSLEAAFRLVELWKGRKERLSLAS